jgi:hypothetical protein
MQQRSRSRTPLHLWILGALAILWNGFGAYDYFMTRTRNAEYLRSMMPGSDPNAIFAWIDAFPIWAQLGWGLGPWCGLAGSILLLLRSRFAVHAFALSLLGMALSFGYQFLGAEPMPGVEGAAATVMPLVIVIVGLGLLWYSLAMHKKGVLR